MGLPFLYTGVLVLAFVGYLYLCRKEQRLGRRLLLGELRNKADHAVVALVAMVERAIRYVVKYVITLSWYYSIHTFLRLIMQSLAGLYHLAESLLIRNRDRARALRKERRREVGGHLESIAAHKAETKLSPAAERKLKDKALRGD